MVNIEMLDTISKGDTLLSEWYSIDYILFGTTNANILQEKLGIYFNDYLTDKASLLSILNELYKRISFSRKLQISNKKELLEYSIHVSDDAKKKAERLVEKLIENKTFRNNIKNAILTEQSRTSKSYEESALNIVDKTIKKFAIDILLLKQPLFEKNKTKESIIKEDFYSKTLLDSYFLLRDKLQEYERGV